MKYIIIISALFFFSCKTQIKYPDGGFDYPKNVTGADTNLYYYQLKDIADKRTAFRESYLYIFYKGLDESNLSIKPQEKETIRFSYFSGFGPTTIIKINDEEIVVKKGNFNDFYETDTTNLSEVEKFHLNLLKRRFPLDTSTMSPPKKKYFDSLLLLYPQLLDVKYYHKIYDKYLVPSKAKSAYTVSKIPITKKQFIRLMEDINSSGYWKLKGHIECEFPACDGYSYGLEVSTFKKYNIVSDELCESDSTGFPEICQKIVEFAGLGKEVKLDGHWEIDSLPSQK